MQILYKSPRLTPDFQVKAETTVNTPPHVRYLSLTTKSPARAGFFFIVLKQFEYLDLVYCGN